MSVVRVVGVGKIKAEAIQPEGYETYAEEAAGQHGEDGHGSNLFEARHARHAPHIVGVKPRFNNKHSGGHHAL